MRPQYTIEVTTDGGLTWEVFASTWNHIRAWRLVRFIGSDGTFEPRISIEWKDPGWPTVGVQR